MGQRAVSARWPGGWGIVSCRGRGVGLCPVWVALSAGGPVDRPGEDGRPGLDHYRRRLQARPGSIGPGISGPVPLLLYGIFGPACPFAVRVGLLLYRLPAYLVKWGAKGENFHPKFLSLCTSFARPVLSTKEDGNRRDVCNHLRAQKNTALVGSCLGVLFLLVSI